VRRRNKTTRKGFEEPASARPASHQSGRAQCRERRTGDPGVGNGIDDGLSAVALVGIDGIVVTTHVFRDGEHWLAVETTATRAWCPY
jgi:hypothetical protein